MESVVPTNIFPMQVPIPQAVGWVNCYYIDDPVPTLIDTGVNKPDCLHTIQFELTKIGKKIEDIRRIIATHGHTDHMGLAGELIQDSMEIYIHSWDISGLIPGRKEQKQDTVEDYRKFFYEAGVPTALVTKLIEFLISWFERFVAPFEAVVSLQGGEIFTFDDFSLEVVHTPGHSPGSICLFDKVNRTLFSGDTLLEEIVPIPVAKPSGFESEHYKSLICHRKSMVLIEDLNPSTIMPGHGKFFSDWKARISAIKNHHDARSDQVLQVLRKYSAQDRKGIGITAFMLAGELFSCDDLLSWFFGVSNTRAHLEDLEEKGIVTKLKEKSMDYYLISKDHLSPVNPEHKIQNQS